MPITDVSQYGPVFAELLRESRLATLGPGTANAAAKPLLGEMTVARAFAHTQVLDEEMARCCVAGVWLYHDFLDESHTICQEIGTSSGSYWHAVMHRREPDFSNSKYWFHKVGTHSVFEPLCIAAKELASRAPGAPGWIAKQSAWEPFAFVDLCESCHQGEGETTLFCRQVQHREWEILFDHCYRCAARP